ncbi:ImmA/IrrE family metallo-endopeptidase [Fibrella forsythiae]|uniref:ImmA/IrrE family metallo-endopeptidase n=1 Tax=Fibrella forsythiae TaxID=2817061 RepID=A0ABS3JT92_9BACT|nr:ImmA/IrrE family metallo-endopeptidase [Fibrella forsythiae]MBO0953227.1 ImmA/IrrE family metallo-endopeptidase [Fibrella forsythiae]
MLTNNKFTKSELVAKLVLNECGLDDPTSMPIKSIILGRRAFYEEVPLTSKEGEIVSVGGRSIITINSNITFESKKRFAAAHELGHYEMHKDLSPIFADTEYDLINWYKAGPQEVEANEFAAEFLMPTEIFYNECFSKKFGPHVITHLAEKFKVSKTAAILKFVKRGNHPVCIVYCKDNKMKWWKTSHDFRPFLEFKYDEHPPIGSVAYESFTKGKVYYSDELKQQIWKSDWFKMRYDEQDSTFYEYCLFVKSYGYTISIIWED